MRRNDRATVAPPRLGVMPLTDLDSSVDIWTDCQPAKQIEDRIAHGERYRSEAFASATVINRIPALASKVLFCPQC